MLLEDAAANPSRFLLDKAVVGFLVMVDLPVVTFRCRHSR